MNLSSLSGTHEKEAPVGALLLDFDGTLVDSDVLCALGEHAGYGEKARELAQLYGPAVLRQRIDLLKGLRLSWIEGFIESNAYLDPGSKDLVSEAQKLGLVTVLHSGNMFPVLEKYRSLLNIDFIVGSPVTVVDGVIEGMAAADLPSPDFKREGCERILMRLGISWSRCIAVGDSVVDIPIFALCGPTRSFFKMHAKNVNARSELGLHARGISGLGDLARMLSSTVDIEFSKHRQSDASGT